MFAFCSRYKATLDVRHGQALQKVIRFVETQRKLQPGITEKGISLKIPTVTVPVL
jgi:hypothetical protein